MSYRDKEENIECKVYVGDLSSFTTKHDVEDAFAYYGPIRSVWVARNPPGFAFVEYEDERDAQDALKEVDGRRVVCGRKVRVERAGTRRDPRRGGGSGYRRSYGGGSRFMRRGITRPFHPEDRCFECGERGHYARDCRKYGLSSRSGRNRRSYSRSHSRSHSRNRSRGRSSRSRSRSSRSRSASSKSRSRSPKRSSPPRKTRRYSRDKRSRSVDNKRSRSADNKRSPRRSDGKRSSRDKNSSFRDKRSSRDKRSPQHKRTPSDKRSSSRDKRSPHRKRSPVVRNDKRSPSRDKRSKSDSSRSKSRSPPKKDAKEINGNNGSPE